MNGLIQDRASRLGVWRNWTRRWHKVSAATAAARASPEPGESAEHPEAPVALGAAVQREVIPRLLVAWAPNGSIAEEQNRNPAQSEVIAFARLVTTRDAASAISWIESRRANGVSLESLFLGLLAPAARQLSDLWEADQCRFEDIACGMLNLQYVLHALSPVFASDGQCRAHGRKVLLISAPAEQSMLGVSLATDFYRCIVAEFFHRAGWEVWRSPPSTRADLMGVLRSYWFDVVDVSASCEARLPRLGADLTEMRQASRNARVRMTVGGPAFEDHLEFAEPVGADASASDPRDTLLNAEALVETRASRETPERHEKTG